MRSDRLLLFGTLDIHRLLTVRAGIAAAVLLAVAAPVGSSSAAIAPLRGCDDKGAPNLCPAVTLAKPAALIGKGAALTFRGRVGDSSKDFFYRISVTRGSGSNSEEIATTHHAHKAVVYPSRQWSAQRAGLYTVCVVGTHGAPPHPVAHDCHTFTVR